MATYKEDVGTAVTNYAGNNPGVVDGELWYDSTNKDFKYQYPNVTSAGAWRTGNNLNQGRIAAQNGAGTQTAGLVYGGLDEQAGTHLNQTESYNGTNWTEVNNLNTARNSAAAGGTQTSALLAGGYGPSSASESWNGTNWTNTSSLNTARTYLTGAIESGTAGIAFGGMPPPAGLGNTELYNGSNWTEVNDLNTARRSIGGVGSSTAGLCMGGYTTTAVGNCESWNGTNWTEVNDQTNVGGGAAFGTLASAVKVGDNSTANRTELWNGTNWSSGTNASVAVSNRYGLGTSSLGLLAAGEPPNEGVTSVEEYEGAGAAVGAWSTGGSVNTARIRLAGAGVSTSASLIFGGENPSASQALTESYDGSTWTEVNDLNQNRKGLAGCGTYTSALGFGGNEPGDLAICESWNGTNWTEVNDMNTARRELAGAGSSNTNALAFGGGPPTKVETETWNGTNWTEVNNLNSSRQQLAGNGTNTSA